MATPLPRIPVAGPSITDADVALVADAARNAWQDSAGVYHERFEREFAAWVGRRRAIALPSCTSAIHLVLAALGIGPGDEVIVPECTWIATAAPIAYVGAVPVFADIDADSWCLSAESVRGHLTPRTRAIVAVDLYGSMPHWDRLAAVADEAGVPLIEDAAEAVGAAWRGRRAGAFGVASTFSFHGSKTLTTGEGGMLLTDDDALWRRCLQLRDHGRAPGDTRFRNEEVGFKYRMSAMQAALGCAQLARVDELVAGKRRVFERYAAALAGDGRIALNPDVPGGRNAYWMTTAVLDAATAQTTGLDTDALLDALDAAGIDGRPFFRPLSSLPAYADHPQARTGRRDNDVAYDLAARAVNLPSGLQLGGADVDRVAEALREALDAAARVGPARRHVA